MRAIQAPGVTYIKYRVVKDLRGRPTQTELRSFQ
jgi:hypothetical protein